MGLSSPWSGAPAQTTMLPNWQSRHLGCCATIAKKKPNDFDKAMPSTSHWFANAKILQCSIGKSVVLDAGIWHGLETCKFSTHLLRMIFLSATPSKVLSEWGMISLNCNLGNICSNHHCLLCKSAGNRRRFWPTAPACWTHWNCSVYNTGPQHCQGGRVCAP